MAQALAAVCGGQLGEELRGCRDAEPEPLASGLIGEYAALEGEYAALERPGVAVGQSLAHR